MKMIKMALLGGAALAVSTVAAQADDLSALKAQIESLNSRIASLEAAPAVPAGYSLLTISDGQAYKVPGMTTEENLDFSGDATVISVLPTADAPAGAVIEWNGYVRAILGYSNFDNGGGDDEDLDIFARGRLNMTARTDTAVGEVGVRMRFEGNSPIGGGVADLAVDMPVAWGWWAMTPELTLGGGYQGSVGSIGFGYDGACTCHFVDNANVYDQEGDTTQMRLTYASGPLSFAIALEDASNTEGVPAGDELGVAGEIAYAGDTFSGSVDGVWRNTDSPVFEDYWHAGIGLAFALDPVALSMAAAVGQDTLDRDFFFVNALASVNLSDEIHAEVGAGWKSFDGGGFVDQDRFGVMGGIYYAPVTQLTIGLEAEYENVDNDGAGETDQFFAGLVTVYSF
jgi:hypothetical protein